MATEKLEIQIGADIVQVVKSLDTLEKELQDLGKSLKGAAAGSAEFNKLSAAFTRQRAIIAGVNKEIGKTAPSLNGLSNAAGQSTQTLTNFSRVVQDAPFGIIGIANNIDPLVSSFQSLKASTGGVGGALKALAISFIGPAGIAVAISTVTSLLIAYTQNQQKAKKETEEATKDTDSYVRKLSEQKTEIAGLVNLAKDETQAQETRARALQKLNDIIPDTVGKLTQQNIATAEGANIIREYVKALEAQATAELLVGRIAENNVKLFDNRTNTLKEVDRINKEIEATEKRIARQNQAGNFTASAAARQKIIDLENERNRVQEQGRISAAGIIADNENIRLSYEKLLPAQINLTKVSTDRNRNLKEEVDLLKSYKEELNLLNLQEQAGNTEVFRDKLELAFRAFDDLVKKGISPARQEFAFLTEEINKYLALLPQIKAFNEEQEKLFNPDPTIRRPDQAPQRSRFDILLGPNDTSPVILNPEFQEALDNYKKKMQEINEKLAAQKELLSTIQSSIEGGIAAGIDQFFNALANNQDPFEALQQSVKRLVVELAAAVVKMLVLKALAAAFTQGGSAAGGLLGGLSGGGGVFGKVRGQDLQLLTFLRG